MYYQTQIEVILMVDLNIDILDKNSNTAKNLVNVAKHLGLRQLVKEPTGYSQHRDSCLDMFITYPNRIVESGVGNLNVSSPIDQEKG